jgi:hypothetical protein
MFMLSIYKIVRIIVFCSVTLSPCTPVLSIKDFIKSELGIEDEINFHVVHRLKPKQDRSPRGIVAKFERRKDRNKVLSKVPPCTPVLSTSNRWLYIHRDGGWWWWRRRWWMIER